MRIHFTALGRARGFGPLRSLVEFFFPVGGSIFRPEQHVFVSSKTGEVSYDFFTFRNFFVHTLNTVRKQIGRLSQIHLIVEEIQLAPGFTMPVGFHFAIAFDQKTHQTDGGGNVSSKTISVTVTGTNPYLADFNEGSNGAIDQINSVTYAAVNAVSQLSAKADSGRFLSCWTLGAPATGTNNLVVSNLTADVIGCSIWSCSGAQASSTPDSKNTATQASGATFTLSTTVVAANCWLVAFSHAGSLTAGSGTTTRAETTADGYLTGDSNGTVGTGSQSLQFTGSGVSSGLIISIAPFSGAAASATGGGMLSLLGVG